MEDMMEIFYRLCKECKHNYHCFDREIAEKIINDDTKDIYLSPDNCNDFYPERKQ